MAFSLNIATVSEASSLVRVRGASRTSLTGSYLTVCGGMAGFLVRFRACLMVTFGVRAQKDPSRTGELRGRALTVPRN